MYNKAGKAYKNIYFDLDRTLWDFETNSENTLADLVAKYAPELVSNFTMFKEVYYKINEALWIQYRDGVLKKDVLRTKRFADTFTQLGIDCSNFLEAISNDYITESPRKTALYPNTIETLKYLKSKGYRLFLLTNGFLEVQVVKIRESQLEPYFNRMITSEEAGYQKPDQRIFEYALKTVNSRKNESIMIGDDLENDIFGAQRFGMDSIFFNPEKVNHQETPTFEINDLKELQTLF